MVETATPVDEVRPEVPGLLSDALERAMAKAGFVRDGRNQDQHDAYTAAAWMRNADRDGNLARFLDPPLTPAEHATAQIEGWILGAL